MGWVDEYYGVWGQYPPLGTDAHGTILCGHAAACGVRSRSETMACGSLWNPGDVLGMCCDTDRGMLTFRLNGKDIDGAKAVRFSADADDVDDDDDDGGCGITSHYLIPAVSVEFGAVLEVNLGAQPFRYDVPFEHTPLRDHVKKVADEWKRQITSDGSTHEEEADDGQAKDLTADQGDATTPAAKDDTTDMDDTAEERDDKTSPGAVEGGGDADLAEGADNGANKLILIGLSGSNALLKENTWDKSKYLDPSESLPSALQPSVGPLGVAVKQGRWYYEAAFERDPKEEDFASFTVGWGLTGFFGNAFAFQGVGYDSISWGLTVDSCGLAWSHREESRGLRRVCPALERFEQMCVGDALEMYERDTDGSHWKACVCVSTSDTKLQVRSSQGEPKLCTPKDIRRRFVVDDIVAVRVSVESEESTCDAPQSLDGRFRLICDLAKITKIAKKQDETLHKQADNVTTPKKKAKKTESSNVAGSRSAAHDDSDVIFEIQFLSRGNKWSDTKREYFTRDELRHVFCTYDLVNINPNLPFLHQNDDDNDDRSDLDDGGDGDHDNDDGGSGGDDDDEANDDDNDNDDDDDSGDETPTPKKGSIQMVPPRQMDMPKTPEGAPRRNPTAEKKDQYFKFNQYKLKALGKPGKIVNIKPDLTCDFKFDDPNQGISENLYLEDLTDLPKKCLQRSQPGGPGVITKIYIDSDDATLKYDILLTSKRELKAIVASRILGLHEDQTDLSWERQEQETDAGDNIKKQCTDRIGVAVDIDERWMRVVHIRALKTRKAPKDWREPKWRILKSVDDGARFREIARVTMPIVAERSEFKPIVSLHRGWRVRFYWKGGPDGSEEAFGVPPRSLALMSHQNNVVRDVLYATPDAPDEEKFFALASATSESIRRLQSKNRQKRQNMGKAEAHRASALRKSDDGVQMLARLVRPSQAAVGAKLHEQLVKLEARLMLKKAEWAYKMSATSDNDGETQSKARAKSPTTKRDASDTNTGFSQLLPHAYKPRLVLTTATTSVDSGALSVASDAISIAFELDMSRPSITDMAERRPFNTLASHVAEPQEGDSTMLLGRFLEHFCPSSTPDDIDKEVLATKGLWALRADNVGPIHAKEIASVLQSLALRDVSARPSSASDETDPLSPLKTPTRSSNRSADVGAASEKDLDALDEPLKTLRFVSLARNAATDTGTGTASLSAEQHQENEGLALGNALSEWLSSASATRLTTLNLSGNALGYACF